MQYVNILNSKALIYKGPRSTRVEYCNIEKMFMVEAIPSRSTSTFQSHFQEQRAHFQEILTWGESREGTGLETK